MKALLAIALCSSVAHASPAFEAEPDEPAPDPLTKLGYRLALARIPLADQVSLDAMSLTLGVEHEVWGALRLLAEYEWMSLNHEPEDPAPHFTGMGHRTHVGVRRALATKSLWDIDFFIDGEAGGGLAHLETPAGGEVLPHAFAGVRAGYQMTARRTRVSRAIELELQFRALFIEHGVGLGGGVGMWWGD